MKVVNFWKTLFCSVLAITAFTACSDDDDNGYSGMPEITVNGGEVVTIAGKLAGGKLEQSVEVVSKGDWDLTFKNAGDSQWCTPSAMSGKTGTTTLTFTLGQATAERTAELTLTARSTFEGIPLTRTATIKVVQSDSDVPTGNALYSENCGTDGSLATDKPLVSAYTGWTRGGSLDQAGVTYSGTSSVRDIKGSYLPTDDEKGEVSGTPIVYIGSASQTFVINNINIASNKNFTFTFTALNQANYENGPVFGEVTPSTVKFSVSIDGGTNYSPVAFTAKKVAAGAWYLCTAEFKLPASASAEKISVMIDSYPFAAQPTVGNQGLRLSDFKLYEGGNGGELPAPVGPTKATIDQITAVGSYEVEGATVAGTYQQGFIMKDNTGAILVYMGADAANIPAVGSVVNVRGTVAKYGDAFQFAEGSTVTTTSSGTYTPSTPIAITAANIGGLMTAPKATYVKMTGTLNVTTSGSGADIKTYYNLDFVFDSEYTGSISYPNASLNVASFDKKLIDVEGWFVNNGAMNGGGKYFTVVADKVALNTATPIVDITTVPTAFAATSPEAQTLSYTVQNTTAANVSFAIEGTDAAKFTLGTKTDNSIVVNAAGNNTSDAAYTANLVAKVAGATLASVELKQERAASSTDKIITVAFEKQADFTAISYPYLYDNRYVGDKSFTIDGYVYNFYAKTASYGIANNAGATYPSALFIGKKDSYIEFPAVAGYKLTSVLVRYGENMAAGNVLNIFSADNTAVSTPNAATTAADKGGSHVFECSETTVNTAYRLKMTADKNFQTNGWTLTYSKVD